MTVGNAGPAALPTRAFVWVTIGWEHTVDDDGVINYTLDDAGSRIARSYKIHLPNTPRRAMQARSRCAQAYADLAKAETQEKKQELVEDLMWRLLVAAAGDDTLWQIYDDPSVSTVEVEALLEELLVAFGWDVLFRDLFREAGVSGEA